MKISKKRLRSLFKKQENINYIEPTIYNINEKNLVLNYDIPKVIGQKKERTTENIIDLVNRFYLETYSFKNLNKNYWVLYIVLFLTVITTITFIFFGMLVNNSSSFENAILTALVYATAILVNFIRDKNNSCIVNRYNFKNRLELDSVREVRLHWLRSRFDSDIDFYLLAERLIKWIEYKERMNINNRFNIGHYIYNSSAKPRACPQFNLQ